MTLPHTRPLIRKHYIITSGKRILDRTGTAWLAAGSRHPAMVFDSYSDAHDFITDNNEPGERYLAGEIKEITHATSDT